MKSVRIVNIYILSHLTVNAVLAKLCCVQYWTSKSCSMIYLGHESVLDFVEANRLVVPPPVPARNIQQQSLHR